VGVCGLLCYMQIGLHASAHVLSCVASCACRGQWAITCDDHEFGGQGNKDTGDDFWGELTLMTIGRHGATVHLERLAAGCAQWVPCPASGHLPGQHALAPRPPALYSLQHILKADPAVPLHRELCLSTSSSTLMLHCFFFCCCAAQVHLTWTTPTAT
jgi:hypothetical protein